MTKKNTEKEMMKNEVLKEFAQDDNFDAITIALDTAKFKKIPIKPENINRTSLRFLVDNFYQIQELRKSSDNMNYAIEHGNDGEGFDSRMLVLASLKNIENQIKSIIDIYTDHVPVCKWAKNVLGVGPMISAYLYSNLDIDKSFSAGSFWSYAGLNDNNTPWLGKENAKAIIKECIQNQYDEYESGITWMERTLGNMKTTEINKIKKAIKEALYEMSLDDSAYMNELALIQNKKVVESYRGTVLDTPFKPESYAVAFCTHFIPDMVTDDLIERIAIHNKVNRRVSQIVKGCKIMASYSNYKGYLNMTSLEKFLSMPPYNKELKTMCFKIGECFMYQSNKEKSLYGRIYKERKIYELEMNEKFKYRDQAEEILKEKNIGKNTDAYKAYSIGKLPKSHINMRAKRYAVKLFLSHFYEMWYLSEYKTRPRVPYILAYPTESGEVHNDYVYPEVPYENILDEFGIKVKGSVYPDISKLNK